MLSWKRVPLDTALNLAWFLLGALALAITLALSRRASFHTRCIHLISVGVIVVALFPYISATDDALWIKHLNNARQTHGSEGKRTASDDLLRLYETLDSPLLCGVCRIVVTLIFLSLPTAPVQHLIGRSVPLVAGRSPPLLYPA